jgi:hypothetical protein
MPAEIDNLMIALNMPEPSPTKTATCSSSHVT